MGASPFSFTVSETIPTVFLDDLTAFSELPLRAISHLIYNTVPILSEELSVTGTILNETFTVPVLDPDAPFDEVIADWQTPIERFKGELTDSDGDGLGDFPPKYVDPDAYNPQKLPWYSSTDFTAPPRLGYRGSSIAKGGGSRITDIYPFEPFYEVYEVDLNSNTEIVRLSAGSLGTGYTCSGSIFYWIENYVSGTLGGGNNNATRSGYAQLYTDGSHTSSSPVSITLRDDFAINFVIYNWSFRSDPSTGFNTPDPTGPRIVDLYEFEYDPY